MDIFALPHQKAVNAVKTIIKSQDTSAYIIENFAAIFLSKLHYLQEYLGFLPDAQFISMPDSHPLRKLTDWNAALPYGGTVTWNSGQGEFFPLQAKPNCCGIYAAFIENPVSQKQLEDNVKKLYENPPIIPFGKEKFKTVIDILSGNHFVNIYKDSEDKWYILVHCDTPELKEGNDNRIGLYYDKLNPLLINSMNTLETPWGNFPYVKGDACLRYLRICEEADIFSNKKRKAIAEELAGPCRTIFSHPHQSVIPNWGFTLGCYVFPESAQFSTVPITVDSHEDAFLVTPTKKYIIDNWVILPHGTGIHLPAIKSIKRIGYIKSQAQMAIEVLHEGNSSEWLTDIIEQPTSFRNSEGIHQLEHLGYINKAKKLSYQCGVTNQSGKTETERSCEAEKIVCRRSLCRQIQGRSKKN